MFFYVVWNDSGIFNSAFFWLDGLASGLTKTLGIFGYFTVNRFVGNLILSMVFWSFSGLSSIITKTQLNLQKFYKNSENYFKGFYEFPKCCTQSYFTNAQVQSSILETGILQAKSDISLGEFMNSHLPNREIRIPRGHQLYCCRESPSFVSKL